MIFGSEEDREIFGRIKLIANTGIWEGKEIDTPYFESCLHQVVKYKCVIQFTRDIGYHSSGWWKNPDFERCYHLSISFHSNAYRSKVVERILTNIFGYNKKLLWEEGAYTKKAQSLGIVHYRLFCDENWEAIKPEGEVYSSRKTPKKYKTNSERKNYQKKQK